MRRRTAMPRSLLIASRRLRREATPAEQSLWEALRGRRFADFKFRRQAVIGRHVVDFYCHQRRLIIELDGRVHNTPEVQAYDQERQAYLEAQGNTVMRFTNDQIETNLSAVLDHIAAVLQQTSPPVDNSEQP